MSSRRASGTELSEPYPTRELKHPATIGGRSATAESIFGGGVQSVVPYGAVPPSIRPVWSPAGNVAERLQEGCRRISCGGCAVTLGCRGATIDEPPYRPRRAIGHFNRRSATRSSGSYPIRVLKHPATFGGRSATAVSAFRVNVPEPLPGNHPWSLRDRGFNRRGQCPRRIGGSVPDALTAVWCHLPPFPVSATGILLELVEMAIDFLARPSFVFTLRLELELEEI